MFKFVNEFVNHDNHRFLLNRTNGNDTRKKTKQKIAKMSEML